MRKIFQWMWVSLIFVGVARAHAERAISTVLGTEEDAAVEGIVRFKDVPEGVRITAKLTGVPPGPHAFHIHETGDCGNKGEAAGNHYNPLGHPHGNAVTGGIKSAHVGDLGNIYADKEGNAALEVVLPGIKVLHGPYAIEGRAIILHERVDDFSQPAGNAGQRIGCGVIRLEE